MFYRFKSFSGPSRLIWKDPDTGTAFEEKTKEALIQRIRAYRRQNNLEEIESLPFVLESYWCSLPENKTSCVPVGDLKRGLLAYVKGGIALLKNVAYGSFASQVEADKRSSICISCPLNVFPDRDGFVKWSNDIAVASIGSRRSLNHDKLGECAGCGCPLRAKVFYDGSIKLTEIEDKLMRAAKKECWQLPEHYKRV